MKFQFQLLAFRHAVAILHQTHHSLVLVFVSNIVENIFQYLSYFYFSKLLTMYCIFNTIIYSSTLYVRWLWLIAYVTLVSSPQSRAMRVKLTLMVSLEDARTSAFSAGATNPGAAAVVPDLAWEVMGSPAKVSPP